jgi:hypothetical protein
MGEAVTMRSRRIGAWARGAAVAVAGLMIVPAGCSSLPSNWTPPSVTRIFTPTALIPNPLLVPSTDFETIWTKVVAVVDKYFSIDSENRLTRTIRTEPQLTGTILEPWSGDSSTMRDRFEATLQTLRKFAVVKVDPAPAGGFLVRVEVHKELEDMGKPANQPAGKAVFTNEFPVNRTREIVGPVPVPLGWIDRGRDPNLEQTILAGIRDALSL